MDGARDGVAGSEYQEMGGPPVLERNPLIAMILR